MKWKVKFERVKDEKKKKERKEEKCLVWFVSNKH